MKEQLSSNLIGTLNNPFYDFVSKQSVSLEKGSNAKLEEAAIRLEEAVIKFKQLKDGGNFHKPLEWEIAKIIPFYETKIISDLQLFLSGFVKMSNAKECPHFALLKEIPSILSSCTNGNIIQNWLVTFGPYSKQSFADAKASIILEILPKLIDAKRITVGEIKLYLNTKEYLGSNKYTDKFVCWGGLSEKFIESIIFIFKNKNIECPDSVSQWGANTINNVLDEIKLSDLNNKLKNMSFSKEEGNKKATSMPVKVLEKQDSWEELELALSEIGSDMKGAGKNNTPFQGIKAKPNEIREKQELPKYTGRWQDDPIWEQLALMDSESDHSKSEKSDTPPMGELPDN
jgi:hypothetical protein